MQGKKVNCIILRVIEFFIEYSGQENNIASDNAIPFKKKAVHKTMGFRKRKNSAGILVHTLVF